MNMGYFDSAFSLPTGHRFLLRQVVAFLKGIDHMAPPAGGFIADFGCGEQPYRKLFSRYRYLGVDAFKSVSSPDIFGGITAMPLRTGSIDGCLTVWVLDDIPEPETAIKEIARVLKPGGHYFAVECQSSSRHFLPHDYFRFSPGAMAHLAGKHGLEMIRSDSYGGDFALIGFSFIRIMLKLCGHLGALGKIILPIHNLIINSIFGPLDRLARDPRFKGVFEANSTGYCYVFRKRTP
jgi:SAM-dependent methyltransferase